MLPNWLFGKPGSDTLEFWISLDTVKFLCYEHQQMDRLLCLMDYIRTRERDLCDSNRASETVREQVRLFKTII